MQRIDTDTRIRRGGDAGADTDALFDGLGIDGDAALKGHLRVGIDRVVHYLAAVPGAVGDDV